MSGPYVDTWQAYHAGGWSPMPLPQKAKWPPPAGYTGGDGLWPSFADLYAWSEEDRYLRGNVAIRLPENAIGLDVDDYGDKEGAVTLAKLEAEHGPLPPTWRSTSRTDGVSGIRLYRVPAGLYWPDPGPGIEIVRYDWRYVVCWPSIHTDTGATYRWFDSAGLATDEIPNPEQLPELPGTWVAGITGGQVATKVVRNNYAPGEVIAWLDERGSGRPCSAVAAALSKALADLCAGGSAHDLTCPNTLALARLAEARHPGVHDALGQLHAAFLAEVTRPGRVTVRTEQIAHDEFARMVTSAVNTVTAKPSGTTFHPCDGPEGSMADLIAEPDPEHFPPPGKPLNVARRLLKDYTHGTTLTLRHWRGSWMRWEGPHWVEVSESEIRSFAYLQLEHAMCLVPNNRGGLEVKDWAPTKRKIADVLDAMAAVAVRPGREEPGRWDAGTQPRVAMSRDTGHCSPYIHTASIDPSPPYAIDENIATHRDSTHLIPGQRGAEPQTDRVSIASQPLSDRVSDTPAIAPTVPAPHRGWLSAANGLLDIASGTLIGHTPEYFNLSSVPFDYDPSAAKPAKWLAFLTQVWPNDPEAISVLQEYFGYVLSGRTDLHKILLIVGPTRSGKGTLARILTALLGKDHVAGPTLSSLGMNFGLASLIGKPLALISDARLAGKDSRAATEKLLTISGEDTVDVDRKHREVWTGRLPCRFVILSNELPNFGDDSGVIAQRFLVLQMTESFLGRENHGLTDELIEELPGILNWALEGLRNLTTRGRFAEPASSTEAVAEMQEAASPTSAFVRERCEIGPAHQIACDALYTAWRAWCEHNGRDRAGTVQMFGRNLKSVVPHVKRTRPRDDDGDQRPAYAGIALKPGYAKPEPDPRWAPFATGAANNNGWRN